MTSILEEAQRIIHGDRNVAYGHPRDNFAAIAAQWNAYLDHKGDRPLNSLDVANLMTLMKVARVLNGVFHRDSYTDIAGYAGCAERLQEPVEPEVVWKNGLDEFPLGCPVWDKEEWERGVSDITWEGEGPGGQQYSAYGPFTSTPPRVTGPREWDSLVAVPTDVQVVDNGGDVWTYFEPDHTTDGGWGFQGFPAVYARRLSMYDNYAPFVERLDG